MVRSMKGWENHLPDVLVLLSSLQSAGTVGPQPSSTGQQTAAAEVSTNHQLNEK